MPLILIFSESSKKRFALLEPDLVAYIGRLETTAHNKQTDRH